MNFFFHMINQFEVFEASIKGCVVLSRNPVSRILCVGYDGSLDDISKDSGWEMSLFLPHKSRGSFMVPRIRSSAINGQDSRITKFIVLMPQFDIGEM